MLKVAVSPLLTTCESGNLAITIRGVITSTEAVSVAPRSAPSGGVPVAVALLVKSAVTLARAHP